MLNAEMILKKGIKPENLYIKTEIPNAFGDTTWSIYDDESKELIGQLTLQAIARECFSGKIFKPIEVWLCCDGAFTTYIPTKVISQDDPSDMIFTKKRKVNILIIETNFHIYNNFYTINNIETLKKTVPKKFNNNYQKVNVVVTLDKYLCINEVQKHFDYFIFMDDWGGAEYNHPELNTTREKVVEELYFTNHPWEYIWRNGIITPINHERDLDEKLRALRHDILQERT